MNIITPLELKIQQNRKPLQLIDVREPEEFFQGHIAGALLLPLHDLRLEALPDSKTPLVLYCHSGKRSDYACKRLLALAPSLEVASLKGGIVAWIQAGYAVEQC